MVFDRWLRLDDYTQWIKRFSPLFLLCALVIAASLILGGATWGGIASDAALKLDVILQLIAVPLLCLALWHLLDAQLTQQARIALLFCFALAALPLIQLLPLPPSLWMALPNGHYGVDAVGQSHRWMPISISPHNTWVSALGLIPPLAIFLAVLLLPYRERRWLSLIIIAVGTFSVFVGLLQVAQGEKSLLRFFDFTEPGAVGFFANRNHFAAFTYALILLTAAWAANATADVQRVGKARRHDTGSIVTALVWFCLLVVLIAGEVMARSRAGLGLTIVALFGAFALGLSGRRPGEGFTSNKILGAAALLAIILAVQYALYRILGRFEADPADDARLAIVPTTIQAAKAFLPLGSGLGTFIPVYAAFEHPQDAALNIYVNRAHNDPAELFLETGVFGLALMAVFVGWLVWRSVMIWRASSHFATGVDGSLARAATIIIALILAHSFVEYPLRTSAMMAIMAFCCALLIEPMAGTEPAVEVVTATKKTHHRRRPRLAPVPVLPSVPDKGHAVAEAPDPHPTQERWGSEIEWPEEWRKDPSAKPRS
jgi:O-antigen ligase